jgi:hypothetical protein
MYTNRTLLQVRTIAFNRLDLALGKKLKREHIVKSRCHPFETMSYTVDTFDQSTNTIYEFHGNTFDGYPPDHDRYTKRNCVTGRINADMYRDTILRMHTLYEMSYNVKYIWEHEFRTYNPKCNVLTLLHSYSIFLYPEKNR